MYICLDLVKSHVTNRSTAKITIKRCVNVYCAYIFICFTMNKEGTVTNNSIAYINVHFIAWKRLLEDVF